MRKRENEIKTNLTKIEEEIERKKKLPKLEKKIILKKCLINFVSLLLIIIYLFLLKIGEANIPTDTYMSILKICSVILVLGAIIMFEISYKSNKNEMILFSVEILIILFFTLLLLPAYSLYYGNFYKIIIAGMCTCTIYYILKCIILVIKIKKKYLESLIDIKTIVAK